MAVGKPFALLVPAAGNARPTASTGQRRNAEPLHAASLGDSGISKLSSGFHSRCTRCPASGRRPVVLPHDDEPRAVVQLDDVAGEHADENRVGNRAGTAASVRGHADLLGPHGEAPPFVLDDVRDADEPGDELRPRMLVDVLRRADLLDAALSKTASRSLIVSASSWSWVT
jgi:hypothetical protein